MGRTVADIDLVVPMVFDRDQLWRNQFRKNCVLNRTSPAMHAARYRSWGLERYLLRAVERNMPWVRRVHLLLAGQSQVQRWMNTDTLHIVYHRDFIPMKYLPLYNSSAIEMFLVNIPDLKEHFIYGNDDILPLAPMKKGDFYAKGKPRFRVVLTQYHDACTDFEKVLRNGWNMIAADYGAPMDRVGKTDHILSPMLLSTLKAVWSKHHLQMEHSVSKFRRNWNMTQYIYLYDQMLRGEYEDWSPPHTYMSAMAAPENAAEAIRRHDGILCVNDTAGSHNDMQHVMLAELQKLFPEPSKYERQ